MQGIGACVILLAWCAFLFSYGIDTGTLYRTEALRAIIAREALNGAWLTPTLYGEPFLSKPPGMYVAIAAASIPFGDVTAVSARLPSTIAATICVLLFFTIFARVVEIRLALAGAMLMPMSFLWLDRVPSAEIDMVQLAWVASALLFFWRALIAESLPKAPGNTLAAASWWLLASLCVTAGFLTKWTAPGFFYLTAVSLLVWERRLDLLWSWRHLLALGTSVAICVGWGWLVSRQAGWTALSDAFLAEAAQRFHPHHAGRSYPWLESLSYPLQLLMANLPWSLLALYACRPSFFRQWDESGKRLLRLFHCWTWPNLLFWSLPAQHHVRYSLPLTPGLTGLGVMVLLLWARTFSGAGKSRWVTPKTCFLSSLIIWSALKIVFVEIVLPPRTATRHVRETAASLAELVPKGEVLYVGQFKDEGVLFYYNRPAKRLHMEAPPSRPYDAVFTESEWHMLSDAADTKLIGSLFDQQGNPFVLVRVP